MSQSAKGDFLVASNVLEQITVFGVYAETTNKKAQLHLTFYDNLSFGENVYLSRIVAAAQAVDGVEAVRADRFQRLSQPNPATLDKGVIEIGDFEIAQLANSPNFRERGRLRLSAGGGK